MLSSMKVSQKKAIWFHMYYVHILNVQTRAAVVSGYKAENNPLL